MSQQNQFEDEINAHKLTTHFKSLCVTRGIELIMTSPYSPLAIANEFIVRSDEVGAQHMKLQKLVYCTHGWSLASSEDSVVNERPEVWRHGPVFPSLYRILAGFGSSFIKQTRPLVVGTPHPRVCSDDTNSHEIIDYVWGRYGHMTSWELSDLTHKLGTPWQIIASENNFRLPRHTEIPNALVQDEFSNIQDKEIARAG